MLSIYDVATLNAALANQLDPRLRALIEQRIASARDKGLADMTHIVVVQSGDTEAKIVSAIGWSPLINPIDESRFGEPSFVAPWDWVQWSDDGRFLEIVVPVGDGGFAFILLIEAAPDMDPDLLALCRSHARP